MTRGIPANKKIYDHVCIFCNIKFTSDHPGTGYCSKKHKSLARGERQGKFAVTRVVKQCVVCGEPINTPFSKCNGYTTCSRDCHYKHKNRQNN